MVVETIRKPIEDLVVLCKDRYDYECGFTRMMHVIDSTNIADVTQCSFVY